MPTLHIVRKVDIQFPLVDEEGRIIRGGHLRGKNVAADDGSVQKIAAAIIDDVDRSLSQHVHIPSGSHGSHVGEDGTKTTTATIAMDPNANGTRPEPNPHNHEQMPWKEKATATVAKSVPRIDETNPSQPEFSLPSSLTSSLRKYPSLFSKQSTVQTNTDRMVHITSIPPPTRPAKNIVTQDGIIGNAGAHTSMALLPAAGTSNASSSARAKRASLGLLSDRSQPCDVSIELSKDNRASHLPPRKRLKYNYTDALELLMKDEKAVPQKKKDVGPSHTNLPQVPLTRPIPLGKSAGTPKRIAACTEEECDMAAALMSLPSRTPSSPSNSSSPKSTTITDGASLLSSIYNRPTDTDNNSGTAPISPISPTQPRLIFDIGAWFDQQQPGRRVQEQNRTHVELREPQSSHISSEDGSSKKRKIRPKNKDEDSVLFKCKVAGRPSDKSLANIDDTCIRMPKTSPFFELGKEKKHKRGKIQSHRGDKGFISHHPHPSSEVKKRIIKTPNSDPNSFFPSRLRTLLELAEDDGLADVFSWQVRLSVHVLCTLLFYGLFLHIHILIVNRRPSFSPTAKQ